MDSRRSRSVERVDRLVKCSLVLARTVEEVLEVRAVREGVGRGMGRSNVQVLRLLVHRGGHTATQLARFLGVTKPRVSQMINAMVRSGLVVRRSTKRDQREVLVELTRKGRLNARAIQREQRHRFRLAMRVVRRPDAGRWAVTLHEIAGALALADQVCEQFCLQCRAHADGACVLVGGDAECVYLRHATASSPVIPRNSPKRRSSKPRTPGRSLST